MATNNDIVPQLLDLLKTTRGVKQDIASKLAAYCPSNTRHYTNEAAHNETNPLKAIQLVSDAIRNEYVRESEALQAVLAIAQNSPDYGGLGLTLEGGVSDDDHNELLFLCSAWLEALSSADRATRIRTPISTKPPGRPPMNVTEKIFAMHDVESKGWVETGSVIRVAVDWIMASELSWHVRRPVIPPL